MKIQNNVNVSINKNCENQFQKLMLKLLVKNYVVKLLL